MRRRQLLKLGLGTGALAGCGAQPERPPAPSQTPPNLVTGISAGDISHDGAVIWSRCDQAAVMQVLVADNPEFYRGKLFTGSQTSEREDFNGKTLITGLTPGHTWYYKVWFESLTNPPLISNSALGRFKTAPVTATDIRFCWSGDTAGQGYGIDLNHDGFATYGAILRQNPDFFVHCGDLIYADNPILPSKTLADGSDWQNQVAYGVDKVAESTQEFRGRYYYNYLDTHFSALHRQVASFQMWDDHEVRNNWWFGEQIDDSRYRERDITTLAERARTALTECNPMRVNRKEPGRIYRKQSFGPGLELFLLDMRSYKGPNSLNRQPHSGPESSLLGQEQLSWLKESLKNSQAIWKIIAIDMPIGLRVTDWGTKRAENMANGDGPPLGRELEMAELLTFIHSHDIRNVHFITADVHYCASHYYHPNTAQFKPFTPFWEFVSGPLHAGTFGPNPLDNTFGPEVIFKGIPKGLTQGAAPPAGYQFFGQIDINGNTGDMTVSHYNRAGDWLWEIVLKPE